MQSIQAFQIVVKGNAASEYYANFCRPSWASIGLKVNVFDAITPLTLKHQTELKFSTVTNRKIFLDKNLSVSMTPTEKSCWYSHFTLWKECVFLNKPIVILEHDSLLYKKENIFFSNEYGIIFYDEAAMGSYYITPTFASKLVEYCIKNTIDLGPYGTIHMYGMKHNHKELIVNNCHSMFKPASNQVMSKRYGSTIEHFTTSNPHLFDSQFFHKFIEID